MRTIVEEVVSVLDEVGVLGNRADEYYKTIKLNEKRKKKKPHRHR